MTIKYTFYIYIFFEKIYFHLFTIEIGGGNGSAGEKEVKRKRAKSDAEVESG